MCIRVNRDPAILMYVDVIDGFVIVNSGKWRVPISKENENESIAMCIQ